MRAISHHVVAMLVALGIGGGLYVLAATPVLAAVTGIQFGVGVAAFLYVRRAYPAYQTGSGWEDGRWTGLGGGLLALGGLLGVSPFLSIEPALRFGLGLLVLGTGYTAHVIGLLTVLDRESEAGHN